MKILKSEIKDNFVTFETEFDAQDLKQVENEVLTQLSKNIKIKGYRPGKVPVEVAKKHISSKELEYKVINLLAQKYYPELETFKEFKEFNAVITGEWIVTLEQYEFSKYAKILYKFEQYPTIEVGDYKSLELPEFKEEITDETLEAELKFLLKASAKDVPFEKDEKVSENDLISINLEMHAENEKEHKLTNRVFEVKENRSIIDFVQNVVGLKVGESVEYAVNYPKDFFIKEFADKKGHIKIDILNAYHLIIPELNEEYINSLGIERIKTKKQFLEQFKQDILTQKLNNYKKVNLNLINSEIIRISKINFYPELLIQKQSNQLIYSYVNELKTRNIKLEEYLKKSNITFEQFKNDIYQETKKSFLIESALSYIGEQEKILVSQEQIDNLYWTLAQRDRCSVEEIKKRVDNERVELSLLNSLIIDKLIMLNNKTENKKK